MAIKVKEEVVSHKMVQVELPCGVSLNAQVGLDTLIDEQWTEDHLTARIKQIGLVEELGVFEDENDSVDWFEQSKDVWGYGLTNIFTTNATDKMKSIMNRDIDRDKSMCHSILITDETLINLMVKEIVYE